MRQRLLVIDDEPSQRNILKEILEENGYEVDTASNGDEGIKKIEQSSYALVLTDLKMPGKDGLDVLRSIKKSSKTTQVVLMTAYGSIPSAVEAIKKGAHDYLTKPFKREQLIKTVDQALEKYELLSENLRLKQELEQMSGYHELVGTGKKMRGIYEIIDRIKDTDVTVLIQGESGTGKELVARAIHFTGVRREKPFITVNCAAIPEQLIESELFGHEKGAFTGAIKKRIGKFQEANGGTLLLDEIGSMPLTMQSRLLRILQEKELTPIGSSRTIKLNVRVLAATNEPLDELVSIGRFREDLFHRLNVVHILMPPLRERTEDIPVLVNHFIRRFNIKYNRQIKSITPAAMKKLQHYLFPGNVRELEHALEKAFIFSLEDECEIADLQLHKSLMLERPENKWNVTLPELEKNSIINALKKWHGMLKPAADELGISYKTLQYRVKKFGINRHEYKKTGPS